MILRYFHLREQPFGVTPNPRFLYASATHREALSSLLYGIESGLGFVAITAKPGMGKTTLLFEALRRLEKTTRTVFLFQTIATPIDLVRALLLDLGEKDLDGSLVELQARLNDVLVAQSITGKRLVVAIDEAQNMDDSVLEAVRMLSNFETASHKLMQIILCGQPQLAEKLAQPQLLQLRQRISIFAHLDPLTPAETAEYIQYRLRVAGRDTDDWLFTRSAQALIARHSEGIPRNINNICFNALSIGCALKCKTIDADVIKEVINDLDISRYEDGAAAPAGVLNDGTQPLSGKPRRRPLRMRLQTFALVAAVCGIAMFFGWLGIQDYRVLSVGTTVQANSGQAGQAGQTGQAAFAAAGASSPVKPSTQPQQLQARSVEVRNGQSLYDICVEGFGECRPEVMREMIRLNSSIHNPDHIESGQRIVLPAALPNSTYNK
jgi:general secretion pathway protein A